MLRNKYVVIEVSERHVRLRQTMPAFECIVCKSEFEPAVAAGIAIGDMFSGVDRGSANPYDLLMEKRAAYQPSLETQSLEPTEAATFKFVARSFAEAAQEVEIYLQGTSKGEFAVISGHAQRTANGWLLPIKAAEPCIAGFHKKAHGVPAEMAQAGHLPGKRIIKGRPFEVGFDRSHHHLQQGAPS